MTDANSSLHGPADNPHFDAPGAADYTGFSEKALSNRRYRGLGPAYIKIGSKVFYRKSALDRFIEAGVRDPEAAAIAAKIAGGAR